VRKFGRDSRRWSIIRTLDVMARMAGLLKDGKNAAGKQYIFPSWAKNLTSMSGKFLKQENFLKQKGFC
jgi:hypothetical protein